MPKIFLQRVLKIGQIPWSGAILDVVLVKTRKLQNLSSSLKNAPMVDVVLCEYSGPSISDLMPSF